MPTHFIFHDILGRSNGSTLRNSVKDSRLKFNLFKYSTVKNFLHKMAILHPPSPTPTDVETLVC